MLVQETTFFYEMASREMFVPAKPIAVEPVLMHAKVPCPAFNRFFYACVGQQWFWVDRLGWTQEQWLATITAPGAETWVAYADGTPCGYFELCTPPQDVAAAHPYAPGSVKIDYFGLLPQFVGRGLGGWLLTKCIERAWQKGATRVAVNTSSLDHAAARKNYEARGFVLVRTEVHQKVMPDRPSANPW